MYRAIFTEQGVVLNSLNSTGIRLSYDQRHGWQAVAEYSTWEHADAACIEGSIGTRYFDRDLAATIDRVLAAAAAIGVSFKPVGEVSPAIYVAGDGEDSAIPLPEDWRELVAEQCARIGWVSCYPLEAVSVAERP